MARRPGVEQCVGRWRPPPGGRRNGEQYVELIGGAGDGSMRVMLLLLSVMRAVFVGISGIQTNIASTYSPGTLLRTGQSSVYLFLQKMNQ